MQFIDDSAIDVDEPLYDPFNVEYSTSESDEDDPRQRSRANSVDQEREEEPMGQAVGVAPANEESDGPSARDFQKSDLASEDISGFAKSIDQEEGKSFRVNAKWVLLTYPALGRDKPDFDRWKGFLERRGATAGIIGIERHRSGEYHIHTLCEKASKWDTTSPRYFDFEGHHPNIRTVLQGRWEGAEEYVIKDGDFLKWHIREIPCTSKNYLKRKQDRQAWERDVKAARWPLQVDEFDLPDGSGTYNPGARTKRRGIVVVGEPNMAKTGWLLHVLRRARYYEARNELNPWDGYDGSRVIVFNDCAWWPNKTDLTFFTDLGKKYHRGGYLKGRFFDRPIEPGNITVIILCNPERLEQCPYRYEGWFLERFKIVTMLRPWKCVDNTCVDCEDK